MGWIDSISDAIQYIEDHITEELTVDMIAEKVNLSSLFSQVFFPYKSRIFYCLLSDE